ncbi:MAG: N-acetylmuramoyl-L-alanine amidase [Hungatella sp.]|nr:N-acetylmuramoyl-L-alanine amidase [Hungatella sp.]
MADTMKVIIDAGHGGPEPGATYFGRQEKTDNLNLALAVGSILAQHGVDVVYTRVTDTFNTPFEKAQIANRSGADYFVSLHRNAMPVPGTASGAETLVYADDGSPALMARNINSALESVGFTNLGVIERPGLVVLRRTQMPAVLVETGFIDNEADNQFFDQNFQAIAQAIADGILKTIEEEQKAQPEYYQIQTGVFANRQAAEAQLNRLLSQGFPAFLIHDDNVYKVRVGAFLNLDNAARMEQQLKNSGYNTFLVRENGVY